jgi:hypothetical protein
MADNWMGDEFSDFDREMWRNEMLTKLEDYESEYQKLKESTSLLELALWNMNIDASKKDNSVAMGGGNKKLKIDTSDFRLQCRTNCGAGFVIENVFPYLVPLNFVRNYVYIEVSDSSNSDDDDDDGDDGDDYDDELDNNGSNSDEDDDNNDDDDDDDELDNNGSNSDEDDDNE